MNFATCCNVVNLNLNLTFGFSVQNIFNSNTLTGEHLRGTQISMICTQYHISFLNGIIALDEHFQQDTYSICILHFILYHFVICNLNTSI